jgi:hypothetical protein
MSFFARFNPVTASRDLRAFLTQRSRHQLVFAALAVTVTGGIILEFVVDSHNLEAPYVPAEVTYVKQWPANRTLAEVHAQQKVDAAQAKIDKAKKDATARRNRAEFQKIDKALDGMGL